MCDCTVTVNVESLATSTTDVTVVAGVVTGSVARRVTGWFAYGMMVPVAGAAAEAPEIVTVDAADVGAAGDEPQAAASSNTLTAMNRLFIR